MPIFLSKHLLTKRLFAILLALFSLCSFGQFTCAHAENEKIKVDDFFQNPRFQQATMSPDGKAVAMLLQTGGGRMQLATLDLETLQPKVIAGFSDADIGSYYWINNNRLVFSAADRDVAQGDMRFYPGLFAVNRDGSEAKELAARRPREVITSDGSRIHQKLLTGATTYFGADHSNGDSDYIYVTQPVYDAIYDVRAINLLRVNSKTGDSKIFERAGNTIGWLLDTKGVPRINVTFDKGIESIYYRDPKDEQWRKLSEFSAYFGNGFVPMALTEDGKLYVEASVNRDTSAIYQYDLTKNAINPEPLVSIDGYDFNGSLIMDRKHSKLLGIHFTSDAYSTVWFDKHVKEIQQTIDALLPSTINTLGLAYDINNPYVLVSSFSDVQPAEYFVYNRTDSKLIALGKSRPNIDANKMSRQEMVHYKARDGLNIPAYLTLPLGSAKKNLPLIVLVHGGPYVRGTSWHWDPEVQFLASRGYAVLQPEFRGSQGFGEKFAKAGWKQWGLAMQDDLADGAKWAIAQGIADPKRIAIAGASYGGYATLMGLAKNPELFRCGVDWVGVTDINLMYESSWLNDLPASWQKYGMPKLIGDQVADAEQLKITSPVNIASKITHPLLMAYGGSDRRVPVQHGKDFLAAVQATNKNVEWIEYDEEGHGWYLVKNRVDFWMHVEKFLAVNLASQ